MLLISAVVGLIVLAFLLNQTFHGSEIIITLLVLFVLFFCIINVYYVNNTDSAPKDLYNDQTKKLKKKQHLNDAFDAILNKQTSSIE